jgi:nuclear pore complex protein Nup85
LSGDESTFNKVVENCPHVFTHWYQILVAHLLFTDPLVEANDYLISHLAEVHSRGMHGGEVDKMILATIQGDIIELIKLSSASFGNWWFVSHLTDLLYHLGVLESSQIKFVGPWLTYVQWNLSNPVPL